MRIEIPENFILEKDFKRGDYALAVMKEDELISIDSVEGSRLTQEHNNRILNLGLSKECKIYLVQMLSKNSFSRSFPMILNYKP